MIKFLIPILVLSSISQVFSQPFPFEPDANTIGLWHFDEASGPTAYDSSGNGLDGTLENGVSWDSLGMFGSCLMFNADYQRVRVDDTPILDILTDLTSLSNLVSVFYLFIIFKIFLRLNDTKFLV